VAQTIVVAFRMSPAGMAHGPEGNYLARARAVCLRGEALGGKLVAWSAAVLALGYEVDLVEQAILLAASIREESLTPERAWATGVAEGEVESLSPTGEGILAWGPALLAAASLAKMAKPGEVLVDASVASSRGGALAVLGVRQAGEGPQATRGWRLDVEHPWRRSDAPEANTHPPAEVVHTVESETPPVDPLRTRIRNLVLGPENADALGALAELRRSLPRAEGGPARCQASLALALMLSLAGRPEEALLESLDALARAEESNDPKAVGACMALLAKLYAGAGHADAATALRDSATG
jgi:hypothetical protein